MRYFYLLIFCCLLLLSSTTGTAQTLSARQMIDLAIKADNRLRERRLVYQYDYTLKTDKLTRADEVKSTTTVKAKVRPSREISYTVEMLSDSDTTSDNEQKRKAKKIQEAQQLMTKIELEKLVENYDYVIKGKASVLNRPCSIIQFTPKPGLNITSREEKVLHALRGRLWIDQSSFAILQSEATLQKPVSVAWFFATMRELNFRYTTQLLPNGDPAPATFTLFFDVQVSLGYQRQRQVSTMQNYRKVR
ncbi:MAG: hypothetical protein SH807_08665 [Blastochloris sp.]|jgi:hypothetical protein|nr:hypothetical protein [Blastochloris sp.]